MRCPGRAGIPHGFERWESSSSEKLKTHVGNRGCCSEINGLIIAGGTLLSMKMIRATAVPALLFKVVFASSCCTASL